MKIIKIFQSKTIILLLLLVFSCSSSHKKIFTVHDASYSSFSSPDEKGYDVQFRIHHTDAIPTYVIINRIRQEVFIKKPENTRIYHFRIIAESRKINEFKPGITNKENGIGFMLDGKEVFVPVKFRHRP